MESRQLRRKLRALGKEANNRFPFLNRGGCCVFAAAVAAELERLGYPHEVIVPALGGNTDLSEVRKNVSNVNEKRAWNDAGIYFGHVAVRVKLGQRWHTYDSESLIRSKSSFGRYRRYHAAKGGMTALEATALADEADGWNDSFDREHVPLVRSLVREMLAD